MTVRLSRQMREMLQTILSLCEAGVCDEDQLISFTTMQRKAMREMQRVPKLPVDEEKLLSALGEALVTSDPEIMGGMPVFAGTRVPIEIVLASADAGADMSQLRAAYSFLTDAHIASARVYTEAHPRPSPPRRLSETNPDWTLRSPGKQIRGSK